ncbi:MAG TPA: BON domain-containing protein [Hyphomicrobiaceae bacterium]|jgi:osmotically-inducible protein OsmY|nr:BON domain-containing protein [Hyphomicrobiaceae bacterium]
MPIWQLSPVDLSDPNWEASSHRGTAIVRAPDEKTARETAQSAFGVATTFKHHPRLIAPWTRAKLVHASHIEDQRFDPEGPSGVLVPSFEADLAAHPKKPVPVAHETRAPEPSGKRATRDTLKLLAKIRSTLRSEPSLGPQFHPSELEIGSDGVLVLGGEVESVKAKKLALERVAALPGIAGIADRLHVKPATRMSEKEIRVHVRDMLTEEASFKDLELAELEDGKRKLVQGAPADARGSIDFEVKDGLVTLNGHVPTLITKRLAGVMAWWVPGVRDVVNGLAVEPLEDDGPYMIAEAVRAVLEKDPFVDATQVRVGVRNTVVRLDGLVPSGTEREAAERDAWCVFGVDNVINEIEVRP